jgi:hypothetical protein
MGLTYKISAIEEKDSFIIYDCTGNNSQKNPGGFGPPNPEIKQITDSYFLITPPQFTQPFKIDVTGDFPNEEGLGYEILPFMVGQTGNQIYSGEWKIKAVISGTDKKGKKFTKTAVCNKIFTKQVECCVDKLMPIVNKNAFKDEKQKRAIELHNLLENVLWAIEHDCGVTSEITQTIAYLQAQCVCCGC